MDTAATSDGGDPDLGVPPEQDRYQYIAAALRVKRNWMQAF